MNEPRADDAPVVKFVHLLLSDAIKKEASEIHLQCDEKEITIYYKIAKPPIKIWRGVISRIKAITQMVDSSPEKSGAGTIMLDEYKPVTFRVTSELEPDNQKAALVHPCTMQHVNIHVLR